MDYLKRAFLKITNSQNVLYYQVKHTPVLWQHVHRPISFTFVVENFRIGYVGQEHTDNLISALKMYYE